MKMLARQAPSRITALLLVMALPAGWAAPGSQPEQPVPIAIERQAAPLALRLFSQQSGIQLLSRDDEVKEITLGPLFGKFVPAEGLERLLKGSGLIADRDASGAYLVHRESIRPVTAADTDQHPRLTATHAPPSSDPPSPPEPQAELETVTITGSYIRRTDSETPSPVQVVSIDEIDKRGITSVSDAIRSLSADSSGTLTQAFNGALAGGASGISLRGLTLDATLVLVDGHRMAPYPLADDGQRPFVDLSSLPLGIVDRVEVLKDGASALYGSDAMAGVVNIILKRTFTGIDLKASAGTSYKADGLSQHASFTYGFGDLEDDGRNTYVNLEFRHQASIAQTRRGAYLSQLDLRPYGGSDLTPGVIQQDAPNNFGYNGTVPGQVAPLHGGAQADSWFLLPGCAPRDMNYSGGCSWNSTLYRQIQPRTEGLDFSLRHTQNFAAGWQGNITASIFDSQAEQYNNPPTHVPNTWVGAGSGVLVDQTDPATTRIMLSPTSLDNPFNPASPYFAAAAQYYGSAFSSYVGSPALLYAALTDIGPQHTLFNTTTLRFVGELEGAAAGWDLSAALGYVRAATHITYNGFVSASALDAALANNTYRVGQNAVLNSPSLYAQLAPQTSDTARSALSFVSFNATRSLLQLPGGPLSTAIGAEARQLVSDNPGQPLAIEGDIVGAGSSYARGSQTVTAAYGELAAPLWKGLEWDTAARVDHYNEVGTSLTPKVGLKWTVVPQFALRGTFSKGFRAPGPAENGNGSTGTTTTAPIDPLRCPYTGLPSDCGLLSVAVLSKTNPSLRPERSKSYTGGFVLEPFKGIDLTVDYFRIRRDDEIIPEPLALATPVRGVQQPGTNFPGPIIYYSQPYVNASSSQTAGFDGELKTEWSLNQYGRLSAGLSATYLTLSQQTFDGGTFVYVGTVGPTAVGGAVGTPRTRATANLEWERGPLSLGGYADYHSQMKAIDESTSGPGVCLQLYATNPNCHVASFMTVDLFGKYRWTDHFDTTLTVSNIANRLPPLNTATYGGQNYNPSLDQAGAIGRFFELEIHYRN
jgi:iron complex outermembrane receptor protein